MNEVIPTERDPHTGVFLKGKKGGPGRPRGSRNRFSEAFMADMCEAWEKFGKAAIFRVLRDRPSDFLKVAASLMPQKLELTRPEEGLSDTELEDTIDNLATLLAYVEQLESADQEVEGREREAITAN